MQWSYEVECSKVFNHGKSVINQIQDTQQASIIAAAKLVADSFMNGNVQYFAHFDSRIASR